MQLPVGSVVRFGESARLFVLSGPETLMGEERTSEALEASREKARARQARKEEEKERASTGDAEGVTWGFGDDAEAEEEEQAPGGDVGGAGAGAGVADAMRAAGAAVEEADVHEKDRKLFERLQTRRRKLDNLEKERTRIRYNEAKAGGLSEGQQRRLDTIDAAVAAMVKQIGETEELLRGRNAERDASRRAQEAKRRGLADDDDAYGDSDDDDFFDRTKANKARARARQGAGGRSADEAETVESLRAKLAELAKRRAPLEEQLARARGGAAGGAAGGEVDEFDAFMAATESSLRQEAAATAERELAEVAEEEQRLRRLLAVAQPSLAGLVTTGEVAAAESASSAAMPAPPGPAAANGALKRPRDDDDGDAAGKATAPSAAPGGAPPPQRARVGPIGPALPPPGDRASGASPPHAPPAAAPAAAAAVDAPAQHEAPSAPPEDDEAARERALQRKREKLVAISRARERQAARQLGGTDTLEGGEAAWVPPARAAANDLAKKLGY